MTTIHLIDSETIKKLSAGQVVVDLECVVKELFENAMDSGATSIFVRLLNCGLDEITVEDNGCGIPPNSIPLLGQRHCTSKLQNFEELSNVGTFGFRGEALYSIAAMAEVEVLTCDGTADGTQINLVTRQTKTVQRKRGTTVVVKKLFAENRIRREEFMRSKNKDMAKVVTLLQSYALLLTNIKIVLTNKTSNKSAVLLQSNGKSMKENLYTMFSGDAKDVSIPLDYHEDGVGIVGMASTFTDKGRTTGDRMFFFVNRRLIEHKKMQQIVTNQWRSLGANFKRKFPTVIMSIVVDEYDPNVTPNKKSVIFCNEEVVLSAVKKCFEKVWSIEKMELAMPTVSLSGIVDHSELSDSPSGFVVKKEYNLSALPPSTQNLIQKRLSLAPAKPKPMYADDNQIDNDDVLKRVEEEPSLITTPLKRNVKIHTYTDNQFSSEEDILDDEDKEKENVVIKTKLFKTDERSQTLTQMNRRNQVLKNEMENEISAIKNDDDSIENSIMKIRKFGSRSQSSEVSEAENSPKRCEVQRRLFDNEISKEEMWKEKDELLRLGEDSHLIQTRTTLKNKNSANLTVVVPQKMEIEEHKAEDDDQMKEQNSEEKRSEENELQKSVTMPKRNETKEERSSQRALEEVDKGSEDSGVVVKTSKEVIVCNKMFYDQAVVTAVVEHLLETRKDFPISRPEVVDDVVLNKQRTLQKMDLAQIEVIGQFNKGFIIGKKGEDLYIIDQHAADEIFNFETLLKNDKLEVQSLIAPIKVQLSSDDELYVEENIGIFPHFGFEVLYKEENPATERVLLSKVYSRKKVCFGAKEFLELITQLRQCQDESGMVKRKHKIFATEACRMSIMVSDTLTRDQMRRILLNLTTLNKPWHCPHGRQTVRHLFDIRKAGNELAKIF
ncbi:DNA mismatch repair protein mutL, putative [Entamoeba invadens IP1]|uniref:DNA mismatch repair protein mutL, putative n=1 Tax=Entamoeba invadens IP1 TaxID=370355 RepID=UPI0002C3EDA0|nr:DNA mismatch repair protein mutL, putative [Entamoeba invadens IP1]ELP93013.1 DNA mismatch repair protein mutL, putative [Entamoeba invadens IP1]|eukprot:XP_004259784.1 DNA mismatch repair protein mutL, putative [Entamoeba invadens IP1]